MEDQACFLGVLASGGSLPEQRPSAPAGRWLLSSQGFLRSGEESAAGGLSPSCKALLAPDTPSPSNINEPLLQKPLLRVAAIDLPTLQRELENAGDGVGAARRA
jgi:hypothetical protein